MQSKSRLVMGLVVALVVAVIAYMMFFHKKDDASSHARAAATNGPTYTAFPDPITSSSSSSTSPSASATSTQLSKYATEQDASVAMKRAVDYSKEFSAHKPGWKDRVRPMLTPNAAPMVDMTNDDAIPDLGGVVKSAYAGRPTNYAAVILVAFQNKMVVRYEMTKINGKWLINSYVPDPSPEQP